MPEPVSVYVIDDEEIISSTIAAILNRSGFHAKAFFSAEGAIRAVESGCPSLLITDAMMRG